MKIVHSFWSKPCTVKGHNQFDGGWLHKQYNYMSWALSCLQFRKYYDKVELVTDKKGKEIFIDQLKLPYTKVEVVLDDLNDYHPQLWALGKIYCYEMQNEPFIHADGDVFVWERFDKTFEEAPLVAQHLEVGFNYYYRLLNQIKEHFEYISSFLYCFYC